MGWVGGWGGGGGYDQLCCPASPKLLLGLDLGLGCDKTQKTFQTQLKAQKRLENYPSKAKIQNV